MKLSGFKRKKRKTYDTEDEDKKRKKGEKEAARTEAALGPNFGDVPIHEVLPPF